MWFKPDHESRTDVRYRCTLHMPYVWIAFLPTCALMLGVRSKCRRLVIQLQATCCCESASSSTQVTCCISINTQGKATKLSCHQGQHQHSNSNPFHLTELTTKDKRAQEEKRANTMLFFSIVLVTAKSINLIEWEISSLRQFFYFIEI